MKIIATKRQQGKTTELIKLASEHNGHVYIVCESIREVQRVWQESRKLGYDINFPITFHDFAKGNYMGRHIDAFYIDNVDLFLQRFSPHVKIEAITVTID